MLLGRKPFPSAAPSREIKSGIVMLLGSTLVSVCMCAITDPIVGYSSAGVGLYPVIRYWTAKLCTPNGDVTLRMRASLSISFAVRGRCSLIRTPVNLVATESNGPRISEGASGFGSNVSRWLHVQDCSETTLAVNSKYSTDLNSLTDWSGGSSNNAANKEFLFILGN